MKNLQFIRLFNWDFASKMNFSKKNGGEARLKPAYIVETLENIQKLIIKYISGKNLHIG